MLTPSAYAATSANSATSLNSPAFTFEHALLALRGGQTLPQTAQKLVSELTKSESLALLDGDVPFFDGLQEILCHRYNERPFVMGCIPRLGIPGIRFTDGPRGVVMGSSTAFPVPMARGATWDIELERRIGDAIGLEARAQGANFFAGVCINLPRHPAWGRIQETYGEDPIILGAFGQALTQGVQNHVMACVKHFALNSMENARFRVDVEVEEDVLHEVYLAHFRQVIESGVASVMSSYNSVNGEWAGESHQLLSQILREQYKYDGFVISDFIFGLRDAALSLRNGLDIEAPFLQQRNMKLRSALASRELDWSVVDSACMRIVQKQLQHSALERSKAPDSSVVFCDEHRRLARDTAARSIVLLKNDPTKNGRPLLPLDKKDVSKIAVIGRLANAPNTGDKGSSQVFSPHVVTPFEGIRAGFSDCEVILEGDDSVESAKDLARKVDVVICVVGYDASDEGEYVVPSLKNDPGLLDLIPPAETADDKATLALLKGEETDKMDTGLEVGAGGDRKSLRLRARDREIIEAVTAVNQKTIVSVVTAGAVIMEEWIDKVPALVISWYAGSEGGHALADVLSGQVDASGRLPFSIPTDESHLPHFDREAKVFKYDRWHGQNLLDKLGQPARFPLGFGLSYTEFRVSDAQIGSCDDKDTLRVQAQVTNVGPRQGRHILQVYALPKILNFPSRVLLGFLPVDLDVGQYKSVDFGVSTRPLQRWREGRFELPKGRVEVEIARFAGDLQAVKSVIEFD